MRRPLLILLIAVACTLLSLFSSRVTYLPTQPCSPGATCAEPVREAGWPLPFYVQEMAEATVDPARLGWRTSPWVVNVALYGLLLLLLGRAFPWAKRIMAEFPRRS